MVSPITPEVLVPEQYNALRKFAFYSGLGMLLVRVAVLPELLFYLLHVNTYLLYVVGPPAILGALTTGAVGRTLKSGSAKCWVAFFCCMLMSVPFSSWVGGSLGPVREYALFNLPLLFIVGGLGTTWKEIRAIFYTIAVAGLLNVITASIFARESNGRIDLQASGTIGNSNDLASHLMLVLPFILFVVLDRRRHLFIRLLLWCPIGYGAFVVLGTASRGALTGLLAVFIFILFRASAKQRTIALVIALVLGVTAPVFLGANALARLGSLFGEEHEEAKESGDSRTYLLKQSLIYTVQHPVFGIGPFQFSNFEGKSARLEGRHGEWHETHNAFTEVSSECGIPAAVFFILGATGAFISVNRTYRQARTGGFTEISNACFCCMIALVGYLVTITFLANAYRFYLPVMIGLSAALSSVAAREMSEKNGMVPKSPAGWRP